MSLPPYYQDAAVTLYHSDAVAALREMPDKCVQTCVTSPPYWGLRDYGTATWEGGDPECDHRKITDPDAGSRGSGLEGGKATNGHQQEGYKQACGRCGARRIDAQLGLEPTPEAYVANMIQVFREVWRVLRDDGTCWINLGDSYASGDRSTYRSGVSHNKGQQVQDDMARPRTPPGLKPKDMVGIPWRVAFALQADGWYLRSDIIWSKSNPMPESVTDRPTKAHEYLFLLAKRERYYYDAIAIQEPLVSGPSDLRKMIEQKERIGGLTKDSTDPLARASGVTNLGRKRSVGNKQAASAQLAALGSATRRMDGFNERYDASEANGTSPLGRNRRTVWEIATQPYPEAHFATFPVELVKPCVLAGSKTGETVLDPFVGSGTACYVAKELGRRAIGIDLNAAYLDLAAKRLRQEVLPL